ncbi:Ivy family c-type lysozyme inhibitor [Paracoccus aestuariivivens]|uniref:C-lysozyme inhibitor n=1 Tax=Paracoccus aestuariivivens TaxID=1820333 RepID=A0A6L6JH97_9RHOB|nr:Ivy family c-type lysozyme inhibitor [Paracoccus aestuariivivens]MTH79524.1 C-lysozyme inhibitor [Paracoccus aestuariivivens]
MTLPRTAIAAALAFAAILPAYAEQPPTLADMGQVAALKTAFEAMFANSEKPEWLADGIVTTPSQVASFNGQSWLVMSGCKPHDCASNQIAVIYSTTTGTMHGVLSEAAENAPQMLTWLNIGGGAESIDGRTILFAALTGSLANHPDAFDYD